MSAIKLHELHRGRLEATVSLIEDGLDRVERLLSEGGRRGIVRVVEDNLPADERATLLEEIRDLRSELRAFSARYSLERRAKDIRQVCHAELAAAWVMLEDCRPKRMKGYGVEFTPEGRADLEDRVEQLLARVQKIRATLK